MPAALYACTSEDRVKAPRVTFLPTYDLSTGSERNKIFEKKRKSVLKTENPRTGAKPGFQHFLGGRAESKENGYGGTASTKPSHTAQQNYMGHSCACALTRLKSFFLFF
jgi:hypothetical protein